MTPPFTPAEEHRIREIVGGMLATFAAGSDDRIREEICSTLASALRLADERRALRAGVSNAAVQGAR